MHKPLIVLASAPRLLAWVSLIAISTSMAYALTAAVSGGQATEALRTTPSVASRSNSAAWPQALAHAQDPAAEMQAMARLRPMLAARGFGQDVVDGPMMARAPGQTMPSDLIVDAEGDELTGGVQPEAWLIWTTAGRWWLWEYGVVAPADHLALVAEVQALRRVGVEGRGLD